MVLRAQQVVRRLAALAAPASADEKAGLLEGSVSSTVSSSSGGGDGGGGDGGDGGGRGGGSSSSDGAEGASGRSSSGGGRGSSGSSSSSGSGGTGPLPSVRLADFGSAVDDEAIQPIVGLYPNGPSTEEETHGYQPPEATIGGEPYDATDPATDDLWTMGIMILELLLGTPQVLQLSSRAEAALRLKFGEQPPPVLRRLLLANAYAEHCILPPREYPSRHPQTQRLGSDAMGQASKPDAEREMESGGATRGDGTGKSSGRGASRSNLGHACGKAQFLSAVTRADPLSKLSNGRRSGEDLALDAELLDLAWQLLKWSPEDRVTAAEALQHPALQPLPTSTTTDGHSPGMRAKSSASSLALPPRADGEGRSGRSSSSAADNKRQHHESEQLWPMVCPVA